MWTKKEKKQLRLEKLRQESNQARLEYEQKKQSELNKKSELKHKKTKLYATIILSIIILSISGAIWAYAYYNTSGTYDNFAKCLTNKGAVMYGASWCKYSQAQRSMFGKSFKYINYKDFSENQQISITPTWQINDKTYQRVQSFENLAQLTGCSIY